MNLEGKVALVTGGAHRVGRRIALALAREGCDLVVHYHRSQAEAEATVRELTQAGAPAVAVQADLSQPAGIEHLFGEVDRLRGGLDILINSAAILTPVNLLTATYTDWASTMDLNLRATFFCLQAAARRMQTRGGAIVNISDVAGQRPWRRYPIHSISKAGVDMLTRTAALALAPAVRVNGVAPGPVEKPKRMPDDRWTEIGKAVPLGRPGSSDDVAAAVVFLLQNDYVVGETIAVDGGDLIR
jgi:NAD(P)-dependent dehydrogenase (short-subunit alcohol dehydrogenase family)